MTAQAPIRVTIFDDSSGEHCSGRCGIAWGSKEAVEFIIEHLKRRYGDRVELEYLDLAEPLVSHRYQEIARSIKEQDLLLPVVAIDGVLKLSGNVEYRTIVEAIEVLTEVSHG